MCQAESEDIFEIFYVLEYEVMNLSRAIQEWNFM